MLALFVALVGIAAKGVCSVDVIAVRSFVSRPDILAPTINVSVHNSQAVAPGYNFLSIWGDEDAHSGPYIFDSSGELVWSGYDPSLPGLKYFNFQTHPLMNGTSLMSVFRGTSNDGRGKGHIALLDSSYNVYRTIKAPAHLHALDFHEHQLLDNGRTSVVVAFQPKQADLTRNGIQDGMGWLLDSLFLCIDLQSGETVFQWNASDHVPLNESLIQPTLKKAAGSSYSNAYDFFHINSVDRFDNGDFLVSARHTNALYRVSSIDGSIKWRLGGPASSFHLQDFNFSAQHDARILKENADGTLTISLFDNAYNGIIETSTSSSALRIEADPHTMTARLSKRWVPVEEGLAQNQGSVQYLPETGNFIVSWGMLSSYTEFGPNGERLVDAAFVDNVTRNYRLRKSSWEGKPDTRPDLHLYARNESGSSHFWMSWNGATEVRSWRVFSNASVDGKGELLLGEVERRGFETHFDAGNFIAAGFVEAVDQQGRTLARSDLRKTLVPPAELRDACGNQHCVLQVLPPKESKESAEPAYVSCEAIAPRKTFTWFATLLQAFALIAVGFLAGKSDLIELGPRLKRQRRTANVEL